MSEAPWTVTRLDEIERSGTRNEWIPIRNHFDIQAFGVNAWTGDDGDSVIGEHDESTLGHEELYVVVAGSRTNTIVPAGASTSSPPTVKRALPATTT